MLQVEPTGRRGHPSELAETATKASTELRVTTFLPRDTIIIVLYYANRQQDSRA